MPKLINIKTSKPVEVTEDQMGQLLTAGTHATVPTETYRLRSDKGELIDVRGEDVEYMVDHMGATFGTGKQRAAELTHAAEREYYTTPAQKIRTGIEGFLGGASLGLYDVAAADEDMAKRHEHSPGISTATRIGGMVVPALLSGGASAPAQIARMTPAGIAARVGTRIAGKKRSVARAAAGFGVEGALFSSGQLVSDVALGDKELSGEAVAGSLKRGALWGAGLGAGFTLAAKGLSKVSQAREARLARQAEAKGDTLLEVAPEGKMQGALAKAERAEGVAARKAEREAKRAAKTIREPGTPGALEAALVKAEPKPIPLKAILPKAQQGAKAVERSRAKLVDAADESLHRGAELERAAEGALVARHAGDSAGFQQLDDALRFYREQVPRFEAAVAGVGRRGGSKTLVEGQKFRGIADDLEARGILSAKEAKTMRRAALEHGHEVAERHRLAAAGGKAGLRFGRAGERGKVTPAGELRKRARALHHAAERAAYRGPHVPGGRPPPAGRPPPDHGIEITRTIPPGRRLTAATQPLPAAERAGGQAVMRKYMAKGMEFRPSYARQDPYYLREMPVPARQAKLRPLGELKELDSAAKARQARVAAEAETIVGFERAQHNLHKAVRPHLDPAQAAKLDEAAKPYADALRRSEGAQKSAASLGADVPGGVGILDALGVVPAGDAAKGIPVVGPLFQWWLRYRAGRAVLRGMGGVGNSAGATAAQKVAQYKDKIAGAISRFAKPGAKVAAKAPLVAIPLAVAALDVKLYDSPSKPTEKAPKDEGARGKMQRLYRERLAELSEAVARPEKVVRAVRRQVPVEDEDLGAEIAATVQRKLQFLYDKAPKDPREPNPLGIAERPFAPELVELEKWARRLRAADDPASVLEDLEQGRLTPEGVEALQRVYPRLYQAIQQELVENLAELRETLPYKKRLSLSVMFEVPVDPTLQAQFVQYMQEGYAEAGAQQPEQQQAPSSLRTRVHFGEQEMLAANRRAAR